MKQVYPRYKRSRPLPFPLEDCSFPRSGLSDLATLGQTTVRSRKRKVLSRKRKSGLDLFLSGIYLFPALQNIYSLIQANTAISYVRINFFLEAGHLNIRTYFSRFYNWMHSSHEIKSSIKQLDKFLLFLQMSLNHHETFFSRLKTVNYKQ